jgi:hypothetical protein
MANETGGAAFPHDEFSENSEQYRALNYQHQGMTLRDYFAAKAASGLLSHPECANVGPGNETTTKCVAREAYAIVDALLAERAK